MLGAAQPGCCEAAPVVPRATNGQPCNSTREEDIAMKAAARAIGGGLIVAALSVGSWTIVYAGPAQAQGANAPAVPSQTPASQAKPPSVERVPGAAGQPQAGAKENVTGTQPAVPSSKPAAQATPEETTKS